VLTRSQIDEAPEESVDVELYNYVVPSQSELVGKSIRQIGLREKANALVVGIERNNERILNPESQITIHPNDSLFMVANKNRLEKFLSQFDPRDANELVVT
jgi:CPA2 family monovalent cation:H+ antiporter-2